MTAIPQYEYSGAPDLAKDRLFLCPECRAVKSTGFNYGTADTPPIEIQIDDQRRNVTRKWFAKRCHCSKCGYLWDIVTVNKEQPATEDAP